MPAGRERIILCLDCKAEVKTRYSRTLRCAECAEKHRIEEKEKRLARMREETKAKEKAPVQLQDYHFCDSPENIQKCLNCTKPKCRNCLGHMYTKKADRRAKNA